MTGSADEAAIQVDAYLDALLDARARHAVVADVSLADHARTALLVRDALVRFHPSFRFEEELSVRLGAVAAGARRAGESTRAAVLVRFPPPVVPALAGAGAPGPEGSTAGDGVALASAREPGDRGWMVVGGAIASGVSLAAGVLLAWRRVRADGRWERLA